ncbi:MAG: NAD(P)H-dependent glycerol-3-phosphate dehydrogenase [Gemmatimonadales bacterium]|nr:NAD(P)H-dependent glycerol-3-phosphate dehydrogenase [Gemmatimonadales bacterium]NIN11987.1 NAD(P)H-dependent glycerol-3-phosphate dehydrogenase [Gemmatimonadales bacterium]NIN50522.1 NAD(P)H-dependent glycerol-3-phosphate dehydrogenase [Gemmatimonadales bacterium]NIP07986.1 NAD(P)H-dependent glycerol-3-phosphate dehydrogenase [Gemmatimonadales bacterium]NIR00577.1 NAD(P)H-dependent glycerol-3-phosphate dehydrogenase [Gemmatimonadales bacterium]
MRIAVIGAGGWGTTLADLLATQSHQIKIWAHEPEVVESINRDHVNALFLADSRLAEGITAHGELADVLSGAELIVSAAPSHAVREVSANVWTKLNGAEPPTVVSVSKGLETDSLKTMSEVLEETLPGAPIVALSGPSFAQEVYQRQPTAVVAASTDRDAAEAAQRAFSTGYFRVYTSDDLLGVQLGGALKNVIAIAAGLLHGLKLGSNTRAALITRGLAEMSRLGEAMGANPMTFAGLAGMGDLILTATGVLSRNRALGIELAEGRTLDEILATRRTVAEGVRTARAAVQLGKHAGVELPIASEVANILFEGKAPQRAVRDLMERELKAENWR